MTVCTKDDRVVRRDDAFDGDTGSGGTGGAVPAPAAGYAGRYLDADGTWKAFTFLPLAGGTLTGHLLFNADNTYDIGASGATRPRSIYAGTAVIIGTTPAAAGAIRLPNGSSILGRNAAGSGDVTIISLSSGDIVAIGGSSAGITLAPPNQGLRINNQTSGAAGNTGTLGNAPSSGNPSFWLPISIAGNLRYIPCWT